MSNAVIVLYTVLLTVICSNSTKALKPEVATRDNGRLLTATAAPCEGNCYINCSVAYVDTHCEDHLMGQ